MNTPQSTVSNQDYMKIGRYQSCMEDGKLKLYYHEFGNPSGIYCTLNPEEAKGLLEMLTRHSDDINHALYVNEQAHAAHKHTA